jgi:hypothetical protein
MKEKKEEGCSSCKKGLDIKQKSMVVLSVYIFITSIYGTYKIIQNVVSHF